MGLLSKMLGGAMPAKKATDDVLLLHGMLLMCAADGVMETSELGTLEAFYNTLPEFEGKDFNDLIQQANKVIARYGGIKESVKSLAEIQSEKVRQKLFILAVDLAMSSGDVDEAEDQMLETMQRILNVPDAMAQKAMEVMAIKYAQ